MTGPHKDSYEVIVVGGGVSGLSAAAALGRLGMKDVLVIEREQECGGAPRHIEVPNFGLREFHRPMAGPAYAARMRKRAVSAEFATDFSITKLLPGGVLEGAGPTGTRKLRARRVVLATGTREAGRHDRLVSGARPFGVMTYGALQRYVCFARMRPFRRAVVVGTEWASFAALYTMRKYGVRPVCMIEEHSRTTAPEVVARLAEKIFGAPLHRGVRLQRILGGTRVEAIETARDGRLDVIACDGIVFTGRFIPEAHLIQLSGLQFDPGSGGPVTDQYHRLSDSAYLACGNMLRPVEASGSCSKEGERAARLVRMSMSDALPPPGESVPVRFSDPIRFVWPQRLVFPYAHKEIRFCLKASFRRPVRGILRLAADGQELWARRINVMPEQLIGIFPKKIPPVPITHFELRCDEA